MVPYNSDRLGLNFSNDNYHNDFTVTDNNSLECFYEAIASLEVVIIRNTAVKMLITDGDYEIRSRLP